jgi:hypothetical protein
MSDAAYAAAKKERVKAALKATGMEEKSLPPQDRGEQTVRLALDRAVPADPDRHEMRQCKVVDPQNRYKYENAWGESISEEAMRETSFLIHEKLYDKFIDEDEAAHR